MSQLNPFSSELNPDMCQTPIPTGRLMVHQCERKVKVEVNGKKYCAIHSPEAQELKRKKQTENYVKREKFEKEMAIGNAIDLLEKLGYKITKH